MSLHAPLFPIDLAVRIDADELPRLHDDLERNGLACIDVSLQGCRDKAELMARMASAMRFPEPPPFGANWDALADCLTDLSWMAADGYVIVLDHADAFARANPTDFATALSIFQDAADTWREDGIPFWALIGTATDGIAWLRELE